jgi:hypothetical protein
MFVGLVDTRGNRPENNGRGPLWLDIPELRPWRWFVAAIVCFVLVDFVPPWTGLIAVILGMGFALYGLTTYARGNDGLSKHRQ